MYIIKQKDKLIERYVADCEDGWTYDARLAKKWATKILAASYINLRKYKKCTVEEFAGTISPDERDLKYKQTLCWKCKNAAKCEWSNGKPVPNWNAIQTRIKHKDYFRGTYYVNSYLVLDCPKFEKLDKYGETQVGRYKRLAKELGCSYKTIQSRDRKLKEEINDNQKN